MYEFQFMQTLNLPEHSIDLYRALLVDSIFLKQLETPECGGLPSDAGHKLKPSVWTPHLWDNFSACNSHLFTTINVECDEVNFLYIQDTEDIEKQTFDV